MFALEDLYNNGNSGDATSRPVVISPAPNTGSTSGINPILNIPSYFADWISFIHGWFLAFTLFYSVFFFLDFYFWRVLYPEGSIENEEMGMEAFWNFVKMWRGYLIFLGFWMVSWLSSGWIKYILEFASLVAFFVGFVVVDLTIIPVIKNIFGFPGLSIQNIWQGVKDVLVGVLQELWGIVAGFFGAGATASSTEKKK